MLVSNMMGIIIFLGILYGIKLCALDALRYKIFRLRHKLLILAVNNNINFDSDIYRTFENSFNNMIRFANKISFIEIILYSMWFKFKYPNIVKESALERELKKIIQHSSYTSQIREEFQKLRHELNKAIFIYMLVASPIFLFFVLIALIKEIISIIIVQHLKIINWVTNNKQYITPTLMRPFKDILSKINYQSEICI